MTIILGSYINICDLEIRQKVNFSIGMIKIKGKKHVNSHLLYRS